MIPQKTPRVNANFSTAFFVSPLRFAAFARFIRFSYIIPTQVSLRLCNVLTLRSLIFQRRNFDFLIFHAVAARKLANAKKFPEKTLNFAASPL